MNHIVYIDTQFIICFMFIYLFLSLFICFLSMYLLAEIERVRGRFVASLLETMTPTSFFETSTSRFDSGSKYKVCEFVEVSKSISGFRRLVSGLAIDRPLLIDSDMVCCFLVSVWVRSGPPEIRVWSRSCWGTDMNTLRVELYCKGWLVHLSWRFQIRFFVVVASFSGF